MKKLKYFIIIGISALFCVTLLNLDRQSEIEFVLNKKNVLTMLIPRDYQKLEFNDDESFGIAYGWKNGEVIQIIKGVLYKPSISEIDTTILIFEDKVKSIKIGFNKESLTYWRHDEYKTIKGLTISYTDTALFNKCLDNVRIK